MNLILAAGVLTAGLILWRVPILRSLRWLPAILAVYGAMALADAALTGVSLRAALDGHSLFQALPQLLQGAFIGGFVILPLGWIASLVGIGMPQFRHGARGSWTVQAAALTGCMALLFSSMLESTRPVMTPQWLKRPSANSLDLGTPVDSRDSRSRADSEDRMAALDKSLRAVEEGERDAPRDRWDPDYVVTTVGRDPQRLFAWVRDNTFWVPYRGELRGPVGVLMDRQGNSLDRAVLLATLLEKAGQTVRLAHGELTQEQAQNLLPTLVARRTVYSAMGPDAPVESRNEVRATPLSPAETIISQYRPVVEAIGGSLDVNQEALEHNAAQIDAQVAEQSARLLAAVSRPDARNGRLQRLQRAIGELRDHWWVQRQNGTAWVELDLLADPAAAALTRAAESIPLGDLPAEMRHSVTLRVIAEQWSEAGLRRHKTLEYALRPADQIGVPLLLQFWPSAWLADSQGSGAQHTLREAADQDQWAVVLSAGGDVVASAYLVESGVDPQPKAGLFGGLSAGAADAFENGPKNKTQGALSAVWLEYEVHTPGEPPHIARRTIFDLVGSAMRAANETSPLVLDDGRKLTRGLALIMRTEILPAPCALAPEFIAHLNGQSVIANRKLLTAVARGDLLPDPTSPQQLSARQLLNEAAPPISPLLPLSAMRLQYGVAGNAVFVGRTNILTRHRFFAPKDGRVAAMDAIDIVANDVDVDLATADAFRVRLQQGVFDTNIETLGGLGQTTSNVAQAFAASREWVNIAPGQRAAVDTLNVPMDIRQRIGEDVDAGYTVVAPQRPAADQTGEWWRIDPVSGSALGVGPNGWGAAIFEEGSLQSSAANAGKTMIFEFSLCMAIGQGINMVRKLDEAVFGGWHPSWTGRVQSQDPTQVVRADGKMCVLQAIAAGCLATIPIFLLTQKWSREARLLREAEEEAAAARAAPKSPLATTQSPGARTLPPGEVPQHVNPYGETQFDPKGKTLLDPKARPPEMPPLPPKSLAEATAARNEAQQAFEETTAAKNQAADHAWGLESKNIRYYGETNYYGDNSKPAFDPAIQQGLQAASDAAYSNFFQAMTANQAADNALTSANTQYWRAGGR
jgi:hypothetical protein